MVSACAEVGSGQGLLARMEASGLPSSSCELACVATALAQALVHTTLEDLGEGHGGPPISCLPSFISKVLNPRHPCGRTLLRPHKALQGPRFEIIYILWFGGFVSLSLMTVSI